jgi:hypothetical protein
MPREHRRSPRRSGSLSLELLLVFPILVALLLATIEFSMLAVVRQQVLTASREGARVAAQGGDASEVERAVHVFLGGGTLANAEVQTVLTDDKGNPLFPGDPVTVLVRVPADRAVPDLLPFIGQSIRGEFVVGCTVMRKE